MNFEITKREVLASVCMIAIMLLVGILISQNISEYRMDKNEMYNKALKIEDVDVFRYGMDTNVGSAFVYGKMEAVDTVTYPEIDGQYMYIEKMTERYTKHERTVTYTTGSGKTKQTHTKIETYWTWDVIGIEELKCNKISFCETVFDSSKFDIPDAEYIDTVRESMDIRHKYYGTGTKFEGTIFTDLRDGTISENTKFYENKNIQETEKELERGYEELLFWIFWILLIITCVIGFYYLDNRWLE